MKRTWRKWRKLIFTKNTKSFTKAQQKKIARKLKSDNRRRCKARAAHTSENGGTRKSYPLSIALCARAPRRWEKEETTTNRSGGRLQRGCRTGCAFSLPRSVGWCARVKTVKADEPATSTTRPLYTAPAHRAVLTSHGTTSCRRHRLCRRRRRLS